jgi:long-chain fatty acid transport protein
MNKKTLLATLLAPLLALGGAAASAHASGYAVFTHGASALGQGNAVTAHSDNPSTIFYNPALMNRLEGTQFQIGTTAIISSREFQSNIPGGSTSSDAVHFPSTFYATHKINDKVSAGLGIFNPFGLGTEWDDNWEGRYLATDSKLTTFNINPVLSYQVIPSLSIAAGVDIILLDATLQRRVPTALLGPPLPPGFDLGQKFEGDGTGVGFNVAVAYDVTKDLTFGASYRSEVDVDIDGDATFSSDAFSVSALNTKGKTEVTLPQQVTAALAYKGIDNLTLEAGLRWEGWSSFDKLTITLDNGFVDETARNWKNSWGFNVGAKYQMNDTVALLGGYVWGETAVPDSTFDPSIPDADTHVFCVGTDLDFQALNVALSYGYQLYEDRTKNNDTKPPLPAANGVYKTDAHLVALSVGYKF